MWREFTICIFVCVSWVYFVVSEGKSRSKCCEFVTQSRVFVSIIKLLEGRGSVSNVIASVNLSVSFGLNTM